jgi:hypothetical protein
VQNYHCNLSTVRFPSKAWLIKRRKLNLTKKDLQNQLILEAVDEIAGSGMR